MKPDLVEVPVELIVKLLQGCKEQLKEEFVEHIKNYKKDVDIKGHIVEGFYMDSNGKIGFDNDLYMEAVYRGKIDTYGKSFREELENKSHSKKMFNSMIKKQEEYEFKLSSELYNQRISPRVNILSETEIESLKRKK